MCSSTEARPATEVSRDEDADPAQAVAEERDHEKDADLGKDGCSFEKKGSANPRIKSSHAVVCYAML